MSNDSPDELLSVRPARRLDQLSGLARIAQHDLRARLSRLTGAILLGPPSVYGRLIWLVRFALLARLVRLAQFARITQLARLSD